MWTTSTETDDSILPENSSNYKNNQDNVIVIENLEDPIATS